MFHVEQRKMDYHVHSLHSFDGLQSVVDACRRMAEQGVQEVCFTEHIEPGHTGEGVDVPPVWDALMRDIQAARQQIPGLEVRMGVEIGDNPACRERIEAMLDGLPLDFRLLSLHLVNGVDCYDAERYYAGKTRAQAYREYAEAKAASICAWTDFDSAAHIGYVSRYSPYTGADQPLRYEDAPEAFDAIFHHLIDHDKCLEVNTASLRSMGDCLPSRGLVARYIELGGEQFTFGSDAHKVEKDYEGIEEAKELVRSLGGKYQAAFRGRQKTLYRL